MFPTRLFHPRLAVRWAVAFSALLVLILLGAAVISAQGEPSGVIAYSKGSEIRLIDANGQNDRRLWHEAELEGLTGVQGLDWRPDGGAIAFGSDHEFACSIHDEDIFTILSDGTGLKRITNSPACPQLAGYPSGAVKVTLTNQVSNISLFYLYVEGAPEAVPVTIGGGETKAVTVNNVADLGNFPQKVTVIYGNTRWIAPAVTANVQAGATVSASGTFVISASGNSYENVGNRNPTWRADGGKIGYVFYEGILEQISSNPPVAGESEFLTAQGSGATGTALAWSPVNNDVLYTGFDAIWLVKPGANNPGQQLVTKDGSQLFLGIDWLPDGSGFVFAVTGGSFGQENSNLYKYVMAGDKLTKLTNFTTQFVGSPGVSPDGQYIAFEYSSNSTAPAEIRIMRLDGTGMHSLGVIGNYPDWKPGGANLTDRARLPVILNRFQGAPPQPSPTRGATATPRPTNTPGATATPQRTNTPKPTNTAKPTNTPLPTPTATLVGLPQLKNGNFDKGANGDWTEKVNEQAATGAIILEPGGAISPRSGQYVAWLGGANDETQGFSQAVTLSGPGPLYLRYYYQIRSGETNGCGFDVAGVFIDNDLVKVHGLCEGEETSQWRKASIDLVDYVGDTVTITFLGEFDDNVLSSLFVDDVGITTTP
ncbi:MAG: hypothetical protein KA586_00720 [Candidatus Promineofilum sp.]|nr:hypothetical protein [Promineifilum sp.]